MIFESIGMLVVVALVATVIAPLIGGAFLRLSCLILKIGVTYKRCWLAYLCAWVAASIVASAILMLTIRGRSVSNAAWIAAYGAAILVHFIVVPPMLKKGWGKGLLAHVLALVMYGVVLAIAAYPGMKAVQRQAVAADLMNRVRLLARSCIEYEAERRQFPDTLKDLETNYPEIQSILRSPVELRYLPDYIREYRQTTGSPRKDPVRLRTDGRLLTSETPLIWIESPDLGQGKVLVGYMDGHSQIVPRAELHAALDRTLTELREKPQ